MKDYKRLTEKSIGCFKYCLKDHKSKVGEFNDYDAFFDYLMAIKRLGELEDKIESGELCDRKEVIDRLMTAKDTSTLTDKEIEFFIKHNEAVRKETAIEILRELSSCIWEGIDTVSDIAGREHNDTVKGLIKFIKEKYAVKLEDE